MPEVFISRQPLVNRQSKIIATRLTLHPQGGATLKDAADALALLAEFWPQGEKLVFINCGSTPCDASVLEWPFPANATFEVRPSTLVGTDGAALVAALKATQPSLCMVFDNDAGAALATGLSFRFIGFDAQRADLQPRHRRADGRAAALDGGRTRRCRRARQGGAGRMGRHAAPEAGARHVPLQGSPRTECRPHRPRHLGRAWQDA